MIVPFAFKACLPKSMFRAPQQCRGFNKYTQSLFATKTEKSTASNLLNPIDLSRSFGHLSKPVFQIHPIKLQRSFAFSIRQWFTLLSRDATKVEVNKNLELRISFTFVNLSKTAESKISQICIPYLINFYWNILTKCHLDTHFSSEKS